MTLLIKIRPITKQIKRDRGVLVEPKVLSSEDLIKLLINALNQKIPFSVVSVGVTESFVLAQYNILTEDEFMGHKEAYVAALGATMESFISGKIEMPGYLDTYIGMDYLMSL